MLGIAFVLVRIGSGEARQVDLDRGALAREGVEWSDGGYAGV